MENQAMSSSSSSTPKSQKLKGLAVEEKATENKNEPPQEVTYERSDQSSHFRSGVFRTGNAIMEFYPSISNKIYTCNFCKKGFSTSQALGGHQHAHNREREWERKRKEMEENFPGLPFSNPYLDKPHLLLGGYSQNALSNDNHLGITLKPFKPIGHARGIMDMNLAMVPRVTPTSFFSGNTSNQSQGSSINPNQLRPLIPINFTPFPPPRTNILSNGLFPQENVLSEENLISGIDLSLKIGMNNIVEIDDDDDEPEEKKSKTSGIDLSLSL